MTFSPNNSARKRISVLKPVTKAYALGYLASTAPRLLGWLRVLQDRNISSKQKLEVLRVILRTPLDLHRFPTSCAIIAGGATVLSRLVRASLSLLTTNLLRLPQYSWTNQAINRCITLITTVLSSLCALQLLNKDRTWVRKRAQSMNGSNPPPTTIMHLTRKDATELQPRDKAPPAAFRISGKTLPLTLFLLVRALDIVFLRTLRQFHPRRPTSKITRHTDTIFFAISCVPIMHSWFYMPDRLPRTYNHWISQAAAVDRRLIQALKCCRTGDFVYGQDTGCGDILKSLCRDLELPETWGDPALTIPIPCEVVHGGHGPSCEVNAVVRFVKGWSFAMRLYLPLQILGLLRNKARISAQGAFCTILRAVRSSMFLGAFISSFWYAVCLSRTRLGPILFSDATVTPQMWDSGLCIVAGCFACGWSVLLEKQARRTELMLFVAARALATILPRVYDRSHRWKEKVAFTASTAIVVDAVMYGNSKDVRGVLGRVLKNVLC